MKSKRGITLIALVITIIVLLILAGVTILTLTGENGTLNKATTAKNENEEKTATEIINLKITNAQIQSYKETEQMPNLQYLANRLCEDNDMEYVELTTQSKKQASIAETSLPYITVPEKGSIFTKLKEYPYEFEIDEKLRLASINGMKVADNSESEEIKKLTERIEKLELLQSNHKNTLIERAFEEAEVGILGNNTEETIEEVSLSGHGKGKAIISFSCYTNGVDASYLSVYICKNSSYAGIGETLRAGHMGPMCASTSASISYDENTTIQFKVATDRAFKPQYLYSILLIPEE